MSSSNKSVYLPIIIGLVILLLGMGGYVLSTRSGQMKQAGNQAAPINQPTGTLSPTVVPAVPSANNDSETVTQKGITMTINPTHGPAGTKVNVRVVGIVPNPNAPYATLGFLAINGLGKDSDTSGYTFNTTKIQNGTYETTYVIPAMVWTSKPGDQNYTTVVPIGVGNGNISFSYSHPTLNDVSVNAPFSVTSN